MTILEVAGISKSFGGVRAVADVSFRVAAGEMLALIGPNGAGKSTCFNMLNGRTPPDAGRITLSGRNITGLSPRRIWRLGVGRTFQITATFASMTVRENVQVALLAHHRQVWRFLRPAAARGRLRGHREDPDARTGDLAIHRATGLSRDQEPVGHRADARRLHRWRRRGTGFGHGRARAPKRSAPENHGAREREPRGAFPLASLRGAAYPFPYR